MCQTLPSFSDTLRSAVFPKPPQNSTTSESSTNSAHMLFRDFLREQIDNLMTGDGRDGLAEGRRGTHVEVKAGLRGVFVRAILHD